MKPEQFSEFLTNSFIKYTSITSQSKSSILELPTTAGQMTLAKILKEDLISFGVTDIELQDNAILLAKIPGTVAAKPVLFMAHIDTTDIGESPDVNAHVVDFKGVDFPLNKDNTKIFKVADHPAILKYTNDNIIVTDGTSVLGADDKAGVTVMMGLAKFLSTNEVPHGDVYLLFVPDEEVGLRGAYAFDINKLPKNILSYTIDGGPLGEFGYETFNGAGVTIDIKGVSIHPGSAKGILVNPILVANDIISLLDPLDTPEHSEGKEGFILVCDISGNASDAKIDMIIRDFDKEKFEARKVFLQKIVTQIQQKHPRASIALEISESYANIANNLKEDRTCITIVEEAMNNINVPILVEPIRGGTDGAVFSSKGLPTPNLFTGAHDIHSVYEYLPVSSFTKSLELAIAIVKLTPKYK